MMDKTTKNFPQQVKVVTPIKARLKHGSETRLKLKMEMKNLTRKAKRIISVEKQNTIKNQMKIKSRPRTLMGIRRQLYLSQIGKC